MFHLESELIFKDAPEEYKFPLSEDVEDPEAVEEKKAVGPTAEELAAAAIAAPSSIPLEGEEPEDVEEKGCEHDLLCPLSMLV